MLIPELGGLIVEQKTICLKLAPSNAYSKVSYRRHGISYQDKTEIS